MIESKVCALVFHPLPLYGQQEAYPTRTGFGDGGVFNVVLNPFSIASV